jgi:uncharacterized damage-inducible protein DinB
MADSNTATPFAIVEALIGAYSTNNRINLYLIENLPDAAWRAETPGGKGRNIAAIVAHMHNVRLMWLKAIGASPVPEKLDPETVTKEQATAALVASWQALENCLRRALERDGKIRGFKPDVASFFAYLVAHDAHHRGQVSMLARQAGHPLPKWAGFGIWEWGTR